MLVAIQSIWCRHFASSRAQTNAVHRRQSMKDSDYTLSLMCLGLRILNEALGAYSNFTQVTALPLAVPVEQPECLYQIGCKFAVA